MQRLYPVSPASSSHWYLSIQHPEAAFLGSLSPTTHAGLGSLRTSPEFCRLRTCRLQGLATLLTVCSSRTLDALFQTPAFMGLSPSEFYPLQRSAPLSRLVALLPFRRLQSFIPFATLASPPKRLSLNRSRPLLGLCISEVFSGPPPPRLYSSRLLFCTSCVRLLCCGLRCKKLTEALYYRASLAEPAGYAPQGPLLLGCLPPSRISIPYRVALILAYDFTATAAKHYC